MKRIASILALGALVGLTGCSSWRLTHDFNEPWVVPVYVSALKKNADATDDLAKFLRDHGLQDGPILVSTFSNVNAIGASNTFGRTLSEHTAGRLATRGVTVVEPRLRQTMAMNDGGEFLLTRDADRLAQQVEVASTVVVGTYALGSEEVSVHLKVVDSKTQVILHGISYAVSRKEFDRMSPLGAATAAGAPHRVD